MTLKWDLTNIFSDNNDFYKEISKVKKLLKAIKKYETITLDKDTLLEILDLSSLIKELSNNILLYGSLMYYKNIKSDECIKLKTDAETFNNNVNLELKFIDKKILDLGRKTINEFIESNSKLKIYDLYIDNLFRKQEHIQDNTINKQIISNSDNINTELTKYNNILRDIKYGEIDDNGKNIEINNSNISKYLASRDRDTRRKVFFLINEKYENEKDTLASILNIIYDNRNKNAQLEDYNSVLEKVLFEENIDSQIINSLIKSVNANLPLIQEYLKLKANILKIDDPHLYDFGVPLDNNLKIKYTPEEAIEIIKNALKPLGEEYLNVVESLLNGHIDAEPDDNKHQSITFSWNTYSFMNFRGSYIDLKNMIHELGHIVNYYLSKNCLPFIYEDSTIFVGETASIVNEILLNRYLYDNAKTKEEKIFYLSKEIENFFTTVYKQTMYTEFEKELYELQQSTPLTSQELSKRYETLIQKYYGPNIIYDKEANIEWTRLGHLYRWSFYTYKYATGLIIASVVVNSLLDDKSLSNNQYINFLSSGSSMYSLDLLKMLNIDLTNEDIITNGFKVLEKDIKKINSIIK